ncbi:hypothetical protein LguiA_017847 [Lonicera macranthoides]
MIGVRKKGKKITLAGLSIYPKKVSVQNSQMVFLVSTNEKNPLCTNKKYTNK